MKRSIAMTALIHAALTTAVLCAAAPGDEAAEEGLEYRNSWVGNSFGGRDGHFVQHSTKCLFVTPDGTCFMNAPWEEGGNNVGVYRDGKHLAQAEHTHGWGYEGGFAVTANGKYVYVAQMLGNEGHHLYKDVSKEAFPPVGKTWFGITRRTRDSLGRKAAPFDHGRGTHGSSLHKSFLIVNEVSSSKHGLFSIAQIRGLALDNRGRLYASNPLTDQVLVYDGETMKRIDAWDCANCRGMTIAPDNTLWIIQAEADDEGGGSVAHYTLDGRRLPQEISGIDSPSAVAIDPKGQLLVADNGPDQQIKVFEDINGQPRLAATLGAKGGIWSGIRGRVAPLKFNGPVGVGADSDGNIYVACNGRGGQAVTLESYRPDGTRNWVLYGLLFVDCGAPDVDTDGEDFYTAHEHYRIDYSRPTGREWSYHGYIVDPFNHAHSPASTVWLRRIEGRRFLFSTAMYAGFLMIHRLSQSSEIAAPSGRFCLGLKRDDDKDEPAHKPNGRWIWRDENGDGQYQAEEYAGDGERDPQTWAWWIDSRGHIWQGYQDASGIIEFPCLGLDNAGNPIYRHDEAVNHTPPEYFKRIDRVQYLDDRDVMLISGYTQQVPGPWDWKSIGPVLSRYDNWRGEVNRRWRLTFPSDKVENYSRWHPPHRYPMGFEVAGEYLFLAQCTPAYVHIFRFDTGAWCGALKPGPEVGEASGWVDVPYGIRALQRPDGEYVIFVEEDYRAKNMMYRWRPKAQPPQQAPANVSAERHLDRVVLTWDTVAGATGYVVRRSSDSDAAGQITVTGVTGDTCADRTAPPDQTWHYTVEAANAAGSGPRASATAAPLGPRPADEPDHLAQGVDFEYFEGNWQQLPDFDALESAESGVVSRLDLSPRRRDDHFAFRFCGYIHAPREGTYTFHLGSDDGSRLLIGGDTVVDHDGAHGFSFRSGRIPLQAGKHRITILYFEADGGQRLAVEWAGPGFERSPIPPEQLWHVTQ